MTKSQLVKYITNWNVRYPYDKSWRVRHGVALFSPEHKKMVLVDILLEDMEDSLYVEAREKHLDAKKRQEEAGVTALRDLPYVKGAGNWLRASEDGMTDSEQDELFDKISF